MFVFDIDPHSGELIETPESPFSTGQADHGSSVQVNEAGDRLYVVNGSIGPGISFVLSYVVTEDGLLSLSGEGVLEIGGPAAHSALTFDGTYLVVYSTSWVTWFPIGEDGYPMEGIGWMTGLAPYLVARPHSSTVYGTFRGNGVFVVYGMGADGGLEITAGMDGPSHGYSLAFVPDGNLAYMGVEDSPLVHAFTLDEEGIIATAVEGSPFDISDSVTAATCIHVSSNGEFLLVADAAEDVLGLFPLEEDSAEPLAGTSAALQGSGANRSPTWIVTTF